ncbi:MAG: prenyltransferase/squalene oxidase repeat-containing protein [Verrucomicrobiota bacterium]
MSLRLEMLQVARLAPSVLGTDAGNLVQKFVLSKRDETGGFKDRDDHPDLYYTSFAIDALTALQADLPEATLTYLSNQTATTHDFVHTCCLARTLSAYPNHNVDPSAILDSIENWRTADGGYNQSPTADTGSAYACFLAYGAYADHKQIPPNPDGIRACLASLQTPAGAWTNDTDIPVPNVPATAAAVSLSRNLQVPIPDSTGPWLLQCAHPQGGFIPFPGAPMPDLLTTAVALHALDGLQTDFKPLAERCLDYIDTLWSAEGGFHGNWEDDTLDLEYTYYGLLALGHLAL